MYTEAGHNGARPGRYVDPVVEGAPVWVKIDDSGFDIAAGEFHQAEGKIRDWFCGSNIATDLVKDRSGRMVPNWKTLDIETH